MTDFITITFCNMKNLLIQDFPNKFLVFGRPAFLSIIKILTQIPTNFAKD
jgi:hypothetical protein